MRYLKEYNQYNEYYYSIDIDEYDGYHNDGLFISFTHSEVKKLMDKFQGYVYLVYGRVNSVNTDSIIIDSSRPGTLDNWNNIKYLNKFFRFVIEMGSYNVIIRRLADEWYVVTFYSPVTSEVYKCDQWEGLIKLIEDEI